MNPPINPSNSSISGPDMPIQPMASPKAPVAPVLQQAEQVPAQPSPPQVLEVGQHTQPEQLPLSNPQALSAQQMPVVAQQVPIQATAVHTDSTTARQMHTQGIADLEAEDSDLIEKPWVDKIEQVIDTDKDDPFVEDEHQNDLSRAYLKKRFNLDVK